MKKRLTILALSTFTLFSCSSMNQQKTGQDQQMAQQDPSKMQQAQALVSSADHKIQGKLNFEETEKGIKVTADLSGLKPKSVHGIHIHENGICEAPKFKSAGEHLNPDGKPHAGPGAHEKHAGDMGNVIADAKGRAKKEIFFSKEEVKSLNVINNKAVILHTDPDDLHSQPSGNAGDRLACGVIKMQQSS